MEHRRLACARSQPVDSCPLPAQTSPLEPPNSKLETPPQKREKSGKLPGKTPLQEDINKQYHLYSQYIKMPEKIPPHGAQALVTHASCPRETTRTPSRLKTQLSKLKTRFSKLKATPSTAPSQSPAKRCSMPNPLAGLNAWFQGLATKWRQVSEPPAPYRYWKDDRIKAPRWRKGCY